MQAKKSLGQHFLKDQHALCAIVVASKVLPDDVVLEIGPGRGALTQKILDTGAHVVAIEKDDELFMYLKTHFASYAESGQLVLIHGDILEISLEQLGLHAHGFVVVANIPYYITGHIIRLLLSGSIQPKALTLLVQKEIAQRIVVKDNKQSMLSISVSVFGTPRMAGIIRAGAFIPPPKVDSAILVVEDISRDFFDGIDQEKFFIFLKEHFMHKRKQLAGSGLIDQHAFQVCDVLPTARPEQLSKDSWRCLYQCVYAKEKGDN
ncbi:MAG: 16S rRNA (adenine(1518)-N(6)/adenine(1519)-N(6))-dimethyltransferase RsmA [bacterium]|nr:16S rRNA (adenine(1518)-N(6)/adenine(1519)-N(6))-dimethyltransferase RsmA [bacterium]